MIDVSDRILGRPAKRAAVIMTDMFQIGVCITYFIYIFDGLGDIFKDVFDFMPVSKEVCIALLLFPIFFILELSQNLEKLSFITSFGLYSALAVLGITVIFSFTLVLT